MDEIENEELKIALEEEVIEDNIKEPIEEPIEDEIDYASFARLQGWSPKEKWRGEESEWVDAKTFVERGREFQSTLKEKNQRLEKKLEEQEKAIKRFEEFSLRQSEKEKKLELAEYKRLQKEALEEGDEKRYDELEEAKLKAYSNYKKPEPESQQQDEELERFKRENTWFGKDTVLTTNAIAICGVLAQQGYTKTEQLKEVVKQLEEAFPHKFEAPKVAATKVSPSRQAPTKVEKANIIKWANLSPAEQRMGEAFIKANNMTREQFLKDYSGE